MLVEGCDSSHEPVSHTRRISFVRGPFDRVDRSTDRFRAANGASAWSGEALAFLENKTAVKATRSMADQTSSVAQGPLHMGKVLVHLFFADPEQPGNVPCCQLAISKDLL